MATIATLRESNRRNYGPRLRDAAGRYRIPELPAYAWPGGYQIVYYTAEGLTVCAKCADSPDTSDPAIAGETFAEGAPVPCEDCGTMLRSSYGDPEPHPYWPDPDDIGRCFACYSAESDALHGPADR